MTKDDEREVQRKLRILQHAEKTGHVDRTCRYFGIGRASFYRWKSAYERDGEGGLVNAKTIPKTHPPRPRLKWRRRFYTADATRPCLHQGNAAFTKAASQCAMDMSSRPNSTGMSKIWVSAMPISNEELANLTAKWSDHTGLTGRILPAAKL